MRHLFRLLLLCLPLVADAADTASSFADREEVRAFVAEMS